MHAQHQIQDNTRLAARLGVATRLTPGIYLTERATSVNQNSESRQKRKASSQLIERYFDAHPESLTYHNNGVTSWYIAVVLSGIRSEIAKVLDFT